MLHPAIWPTSSSAERRRRVAALVVLVVGIGWLTAHAVLELTGAVPRAMTHSWLLTTCDLVTFAGFLMAVPVPRLRRTALARLAWTVAGRLAVPFGVGTAVVYAANHDGLAGPTTRVLVVAGWWLTLVFAASQVVRIVAEVDLADVSMPGPRRLGLGLWLVAFGLAGSGLTILVQALAGSGDRVAGFMGGAAVVALGVSVNGTVRDLAEVRIADLDLGVLVRHCVQVGRRRSARDVVEKGCDIVVLDRQEALAADAPESEQFPQRGSDEVGGEVQVMGAAHRHQPAPACARLE